MSFDFGYKDPKEMSAFKVIAEGDGFFKIVEAKETVSKADNPMLVLTHKLQDTRGQSTLWYQYILQNEFAADNIYRICEAANRLDLYGANGKINSYDLLGLKGRCKIKTEKSEQYGDKSKVGKFVPYKPMQEEAPAEPAPDINDDLPF